MYSKWNPLIATFTLMITLWLLPFLLISKFIISNIFFTRVSIKQQPFHSASSNCIYSSNQETPHRFRHPPQYAFKPNHISHEFILFAPPSLYTHYLPLLTALIRLFNVLSLPPTTFSQRQLHWFQTKVHSHYTPFLKIMFSSW